MSYIKSLTKESGKNRAYKLLIAWDSSKMWFRDSLPKPLNMHEELE